MKPTRICAAVAWTAVLPFVALDSVAAQNPGDRVRVVIAGDTLTGDVTETSDSGLTLTLSSGMLSGYTREREVAYEEIETLEVGTCCGDAVRLAVVGGGLVLGIGLGRAISETCTETRLGLISSRTCTGSGRHTLLGGLFGGSAALVAALTVLKPGWETIPLRAPGGPSVAPLVGFRRDGGPAAMILGARVRL